MPKSIRSLWLFGVLALAACATTVPPAIDKAPPDSPDIATVLADPGRHVSQPVRWGGTILELDNRADSTWITVLALPLGAHGEPQGGGASPGRFLAAVAGFLDPMVYTQNRRITLAGTLTGTETRQVGEYGYVYPVLKVEDHYLWADPPEYSDDDYPYWWYDPWYDPWYYPWYPYYYPRHFLHR